MYEDYFELSANPFRLTPDAAFYYPSSEHQRALSFLHYGVEQGDGFIVITGDPGTGKTILVGHLVETAVSHADAGARQPPGADTA